MTENISSDGDAVATDSMPEATVEKNATADSPYCVDDELVADDVTAYPDFSKLKGRVCLDSLSVRELQQTFRATFGRSTAVKDKLWLKRRIAMSLSNSNSCQIPTMTFLIENEKVVKIGGLDENPGVVERVVGSGYGDSLDRDQWQVKQARELRNVCTERAANVGLHYDVACDGAHLDHRGGKRVRKPTKRYIEELSEVEPNQLGGIQSPSVKISSRGRTINTPRHSSIQNMYPDAKTAVTLDSFGRSRIQVPLGSRVRRSRPRENIASLLLTLPEENRKSPVADTINLQPKLDQSNKPMDSVPTRSDDGRNIVPPITGEMSRKHHRAWTLSEVMKLVDGVSRYGVGKWSEIKRLSFTSYPYRSSVDLKDKWRNLLRVSFTDPSRDNKKVSSRKQIQTPLPAPILSRVRELAERQGQIPPVSSKVIGSCERGPGSGFL